ncbi:hypothetical protein GF358_00995 [Candidatus Woesearchaeota archaeon]|nr:hypothetical protein [Candidatus Woesearchaeota archaeon]
MSEDWYFAGIRTKKTSGIPVEITAFEGLVEKEIKHILTQETKKIYHNIEKSAFDRAKTIAQTYSSSGKKIIDQPEIFDDAPAKQKDLKTDST